MLKVHVARSLSSKLVRTTTVWTLLLGVLFSAVQIAIDFSRTKQLPDEDMTGLINMIKEPVTAIVFSLDLTTANQMLLGMLKHPAVSSSKIVLADGSLFAQQTRPLASSRERLVNDFMFGVIREFKWQLTAKTSEGLENLGSLVVEVDTYRYGSLFLERVWIVLGFSLAYALVLMGILLSVFYVLVTYPLVKVIESISQIEVKSSEKTRLNQPEDHSDDEIGLLVTLTNGHLQSMTNNLLQLRMAEEKLREYSEGLETTVSERTEALSQSLKQLQTTQSQLIQSEKLSALGGLVAGVAHEVNTPLGIAVTAASVLEENINGMRQQFEDQILTADALREFIEIANESQSMLIGNLNRAAKLIRDFKQTAVDQVSETKTEFNVSQVLNALLSSLHPATRKVPVIPKLICAGDIVMKSLPGVITQVLSNLIMNSINHAFENTQNAQIVIVVELDGNWVTLDYRDNGVGVPLQFQKHIFEPFFTTKRGQGGSGLGLNIVFNLVTGKLKGRLEFESPAGQGVHFRMYIPREMEANLNNLDANI